MNIDLNTAAFQSYQLAQQLVNHYIAYKASPPSVGDYAKEFYTYLTSDIPHEFDTLLQSLHTTVGRLCANMAAGYGRHNAANNAKILEASQNMENLMRATGSGSYYGTRMRTNLENFKVVCVSPVDVVDQSFKELDQYAKFVQMALTNSWGLPLRLNQEDSDDAHFKEMAEMKDEHDAYEMMLFKMSDVEKKRTDKMSKMSVYNEAYLIDLDPFTPSKRSKK